MLGAGLGVEMKDDRRLVEDPHVVSTDKVRKVVVPRQTFTARLGNHVGQFALQAALAEPIDLLFKIYATVPYLQRRQLGQRCHVRPVGFDRGHHDGPGLLFRRPRNQRGDCDAGREALYVDREIDSRQRLVKIVGVEQDVVFRRHERAEVHQMAVAAGLHRQMGYRLIGKIGCHDGRRAAQECEGIDRHASVALRHQFRHAILVAFRQDGDGIARQLCRQIRVRFTRRLGAKGLTLLVPVGARTQD